MFPADSAVDYLGMMIWALGTITICAATVLLFLADRRPHTLCVMVGFFLFAGSMYGELFLLTWMSEHGETRYFDSLEEISVESSVDDLVGVAYSTITYEKHKLFAYLNLIAIILLAYGLLTTAIIQFRRSRAPDFQKE